MSAVNRSRRKNAGKRMAALGKKMEEEDEAFWNHETWAEDEDSGNESFHESDEDSALQKDVFDSDFNDSESDNEEDEVAAGEAEERELRKSERAKKRKITIHTAYRRKLDDDVQGKGKGKRGYPGGIKRILGEGSNAGIVLNLPPGVLDSLAFSMSLSSTKPENPLPQPIPTPILPPTIATTPMACPVSDNNRLNPEKSPPQPSPAKPPTGAGKSLPLPSTTRKSTRRTNVVEPVTRSSRSSSRATRKDRALRNRPGSSTQAKESSSNSANDPSNRKKIGGTSRGSASSSMPSAKQPKRIAQEELLMEAVHETEPENQRWLHGRKRVQDQHDRDKDANAGLRDKHRGKKVIQKFHSRRGCLITLTFPEMDAIPDILTRKHHVPQHPPQRIHQRERGHDVEDQSVSALSNQHSSEQKQGKTLSNRCVITGKNGKYKDPLTNCPYHDLSAFKELRRRHKFGIPIVPIGVPRTSTQNKIQSNVVEDRSKKRKMDSNEFQNGELRASKRPIKNDKGSQLRSKASEVNEKEQEKKSMLSKPQKMIPSEHVQSSSSKTKNNPKLPFQSPIPPPKTKVKTSGTLDTQSANLGKLALAWDPLGASKLSATKTNQPTSSDLKSSPVSPGGTSRRLSPRKWKPSEKVLQSIGMSSGLDSGGSGNIAAVIPKGLGIISQVYQPQSSHSSNRSESKPKSVVSIADKTSPNSDLPRVQLAFAPNLMNSEKPTDSTPRNISGNNACDPQPSNGQSIVKDAALRGNDCGGNSVANLVSTPLYSGTSAQVPTSPSDVITAKLGSTTADGNNTVLKGCVSHSTTNIGTK